MERKKKEGTGKRGRVSRGLVLMETLWARQGRGIMFTSLVRRLSLREAPWSNSHKEWSWGLNPSLLIPGSVVFLLQKLQYLSSFIFLRVVPTEHFCERLIHTWMKGHGSRDFSPGVSGIKKFGSTSGGEWWNQLSQGFPGIEDDLIWHDPKTYC